MTKIMPCPFCGLPATPEIESNDARCFWVICDNVKDGCGCEGPYKTTPEKAIEAWNRRTPTPETSSVGSEPTGYVYDIDGPLPVFSKAKPTEDRWLVFADAPIAVYAATPSSILSGPDAFEMAAKLIEENVIMDTSAGKVLRPRQEDNRDGLHYAVAIRALVTNHGCKSDLHPAYVTPEGGK